LPRETDDEQCRLIDAIGWLELVYLRDPDGNLVEVANIVR
jgi:catechol 2,3-dioxygenase-like lactoylglutathione lyase family enzyme